MVQKDFREWLADTLIPDESYYATLARIHQLDPDQQKVQMQDEVLNGSLAGEFGV